MGQKEDNLPDWVYSLDKYPMISEVLNDALEQKEIADESKVRPLQSK